MLSYHYAVVGFYPRLRHHLVGDVFLRLLG